MRLLSAALVLGLAAPAVASTWESDASHTAATFSVRHMMVSDVRGEFTKASAVLNLDDKDVTKSTVEVTIDANTVNTRDAKRDAHLKSPDFFDAAKFPNITFKSTKVEKAGEGKLKITGDLTIKGITKPATFEAAFTGKEIKNPWGGGVLGGVATATINRKDFKVDWNKTLDAGGVLVGDEVALNFSVEFAQKKAVDASAKK